jgi:ABC-2 type transport system ATP-binding protein
VSNVKPLELFDAAYSYGKFEALAPITRSFGYGGLAVLGPNGGGKSTLLKMFATVIQPTQGDLRVLGLSVSNRSEVRGIRGSLGYAPQGFALPGHLTPRNAVRYAAWLKGVARHARSREAERCLDAVSMPQRYRSIRCSQLSGGYQRRTVIACALTNDPQVVILDEPTAGLDQATAEGLRVDFSSLRDDRVLVIATHLREDVEALCGHALALSEGRIIADTPRSAWETRPSLLSDMARGHVAAA